MTIEEYFSTGPVHERPVFDAVHAHLLSLGPIHIEPVSVGILIKKSSSFVELRPMTRWVAMSFPMPRRITSDRIARQPIDTGSSESMNASATASPASPDTKAIASSMSDAARERRNAVRSLTPLRPSS